MMTRTSAGRLEWASIRLIRADERPEPLCRARRSDHTVLRQRPSSSACASRVTAPASNKAFFRVFILLHWSIFIVASVHPGPSKRAVFSQDPERDRSIRCAFRSTMSILYAGRAVRALLPSIHDNLSLLTGQINRAQLAAERGHDSLL